MDKKKTHEKRRKMDKEKTHEIWVQLFLALIVGNGGANLKFLANEADEALKLAQKRYPLQGGALAHPMAVRFIRMRGE